MLNCRRSILIEDQKGAFRPPNGDFRCAILGGCGDTIKVLNGDQKRLFEIFHADIDVSSITEISHIADDPVQCPSPCLAASA